MPIWKQHISKRGSPLREEILQMYGIAIWWTEAQVDGSVFHVWSFHGLRPWALILNDWEAALRRLRVDVWWWGSFSSWGRENLKFRDTFHASLGIDLTIQIFRKRKGNCFLYDCLEQRRVGFLNKRGVSKKLPTECLWNPFYRDNLYIYFFAFPLYSCFKRKMQET